MVNLFQTNNGKLLVTYITSIAFTCVTLSPPNLMAYEIAAKKGISINDINFGIRVEQIFEKIKKAIDNKDTNKVIDYMFDFKREVEQYTGKLIDIHKAIDQAEKAAGKKGQKIESKYLGAIKREFDKIDRRNYHRAVWFAQCDELEIPYSTVEADAYFEMNDVMAKSRKDKDKNNITIEEVPLKITVGVTVTLCGIFLYTIPLPGCQVVGKILLEAGIGVLSTEALEGWSQYDKNKHNR